MEIDVLQLLPLIWLKVSDFVLHSALFTALKFFLFVYAGVLLVDIILLLVHRGISSDLKTALYGADRPLVSKNALIKRWEATRERLQSHDPAQYKVAVLEADTLADEILGAIGYHGETMTEKLATVKGGQLETKDVLVAAHEVRNQIVHDGGFVLTQEEARHLVDEYQQFFDEVELF